MGSDDATPLRRDEFLAGDDAVIVGIDGRKGRIQRGRRHPSLQMDAAGGVCLNAEILKQKT